MTQLPVIDLLEAARQVRDGVSQAGQEHIHPEWQRLLGAIATHILTDDLSQFTRWPAIAQTMFVADYADTARQLAALRARDDWRTRWEPALIESAVGGAPGSVLHPPSSGNQIRQAYALSRFEDEAGLPVHAFDQIVELGGGFGALCLLAFQLGFRGRYLIADNEPVRGLQRWYLTQNGLAVLPGDDVRPGPGIQLLPTTRLERALEHDGGRTALLANWSLSETPVAFRDQVFRALRRTHTTAVWVTYQKAWGLDNSRYFLGRLADFAGVYEATVRPFWADASPDDYYYGHSCLALKRIPGRCFPRSADRLPPAPFETTDMRHLTVSEAGQTMREAIAARRPLSCIRLGDGEARVIGYPEYVPRHLVADIWQTWFGRPDFTEDQLERVRTALKLACLDADIVGVPQAEADIESEFGRVKALLPREGFVRREASLCHAGFHMRFEHERLYPVLLHGLPQVGMIGPRDLTGIFPAIAGVPRVIWLPVPPEMKFSDLPEGERARLSAANYHLATRFSELVDSILPRTLQQWPGLVVLVGAGVLGKIYCHRIKQLGGIAIDVGSMMDVWAGLKTRDNHRFPGLRTVHH